MVRTSDIHTVERMRGNYHTHTLSNFAALTIVGRYVSRA